MKCKYCGKEIKKSNVINNAHYNCNPNIWASIYRQSEYGKKYLSRYYKHRRKVDGKFKMTLNVRAMVVRKLQQNKQSKTQKYTQLLGCDFNKLINHVEGKFCKYKHPITHKSMTWNNYSGLKTKGTWVLKVKKHNNANTNIFNELNYKNLIPMWRGIRNE